MSTSNLHISPRRVFSAHTLADEHRLLEERATLFLLFDNELRDGYGWPEAPGIHKKSPGMRLTLISADMHAKATTVGGMEFRILHKPVSLAIIEC